MAEDELLARWVTLVGRWGGPADQVETAGRDLITRYGEPWRRYHTVEHLAEVLSWIDRLAPVTEQVEVVELAAWFHDAVYDPRAGAGVNEAASAALAEAALGRLSVPPSITVDVHRLVLMTATHTPPDGDVDGATLADADLAILGGSADRYARYSAGVRAEYGWVDERAWREGRAAVLARFLDRPRLYRTDIAHEALDRAARANLAGELAALGRGQPEP